MSIEAGARPADVHAGPAGGGHVAAQVGQASQAGQATVELAAVLPLLFGLVLLVVQAGLVVRDQVLVVHAAREAARVAAIEGDRAAAFAAARSATGLDRDRLAVEVRWSSNQVTASVRFRSLVVVPLLRRTLPAVPLSAAVTMHDEAAG